MRGVIAYLAGISIAAGVLTADVAVAADEKGEFGIRGAGLVTCSIYTREREARSQIYYIIAAWMDGYITGANEHADDTYDIVSFESAELLGALVNENCKKHPQASVFVVLRAILQKSAENRLTAPSKKVEVAIGDRKVFLYEEVLKRAQQKLASAGFYKGPITAEYDARTQEAIKAFQSSIGLEPTGFPDQLTLWRLFNRES